MPSYSILGWFRGLVIIKRKEGCVGFGIQDKLVDILGERIAKEIHSVPKKQYVQKITNVVL